MRKQHGPTSDRQAWRHVALGALAVVIVLAVCGLVRALLPTPDAMPRSIWIRGVDGWPEGIRAGSPDGPELARSRLVSSYRGPDGRLAVICLASTLTTADKLGRGLANLRVLPRHRIFGPGYAATGSKVEHAGDVWREFVLFDKQFHRVRYGWWKW